MFCPHPSLSIRGGKVFCSIRKKWLRITPGELVRQSTIVLLCQHYPKTALAVEKTFLRLGRKFRYDIAVYSSEMQVFLLVECKQPHIPIRGNAQMIRQVQMYYSQLLFPHLLMTNGVEFVCFRKQGNTFSIQADLPAWT